MSFELEQRVHMHSCTTRDMRVYFLYYVTWLGITQERIELNYDIYTTSST